MAELSKKVGLKERLGGFGKRFENPFSSNFTPGPGYYFYNNTCSSKQSTSAFKSKTKRGLNEVLKTGLGKYYDCGYNDIGSKTRRRSGNVLFKFFSLEDHKKPAFQSIAPRFTKKDNRLPGPCYYNAITKGSLTELAKRLKSTSKPYNKGRKGLCKNIRYLVKHKP